MTDRPELLPVQRPSSHRATLALCAALAFWLAAGSLPASAQSAEPAHSQARRPKICLVLSGGGARGAAHVGVLKVLEEYRVPIDCIAATSMGALVGAAYATGTTVAEMQAIVGQITTETLYKENPPRTEVDMRRKLDDNTLLFGPELGIGRDGLKLPKGVVTGVQLESFLRQLAKARGYHQFDQLQIPFRAVATDLVSGKAVVFSEGELANVMRASMSVPGAVAPAEFAGMMLVDGMLTSNLPIQTARAMGADIIIAVNVGTPLLKRDALNSIVAVSSQMLSILTEQNVQASIATLTPADILISPELGDFSTGDFDHLAEITPAGEAGARKLASRLAQLSLPEAEYAQLRQRQLLALAPDVKSVDEIRFDPLQRVNPQAVRSAMETRTGETIDQPTLDRDMRRLYGTGYFEHVNYRLLEEPGKRVLAVEAVEKSWGPNFIRFGLGMSSDFKGDAYFNLLASYRQTWINSLGAEWRTDLQVGQDPVLSSEFYQPLNAEGIFFVAPRLVFGNSSFNLYQGDQRYARFQVGSRLAGLDLGAQLGRSSELRLGLVRGAMLPELQIGPPTLAPASPRIQQGGLRTRWLLDRLDSVNFARSGSYGEVNLLDSARQMGAQDNYVKWSASGTSVYSFGENTFNFNASLGGRAGSHPLPTYDQFLWGGFLRQSGYATGQFFGEDLRFARVLYYRRIMRGSMLDGAYGGLSLEAGKVGNQLVPGNNEGLMVSTAAFAAAATPIGPLYVGYGRARSGASSFYIYLGRPF